MNSKPLVSGIMIFLNAEKFIEEAIESVFSQTCDNWELLLVDDGSTDSSTKIAQRYTEQYPDKVRYLEHEGHCNRGKSAARNLGINHAKGEYIAFLDADDIWLPLKLERQVAILEAQPDAAMVYGPTLFWYSWTGNSEDIENDCMSDVGVQLDTLVKPPTLLTIFFLQNENVYPCTCSVLVRREVFEDVGGFEEVFQDTYEDTVFFAKVLLNAPVFVSSECWDKYRQHAGSSWVIAEETGQYHPLNPNPARRAFLTWLDEYLSKQGFKETEIWKVLQRELLPYRHPMLYHLHPRYLKRRMREPIKSLGKRTLPTPIYRWLLAKWRGPDHFLPVGGVNLGDLRRLKPISSSFGYDRGCPIDRYYIENFLPLHAEDIQGHVLEIGELLYIRQFGGDRVTRSDVLHVKEGNPIATIVGDLTCADHIPADNFDCIILTQTLQLIYDMPAALKTLYRILKPGGVLLATFPGISHTGDEEWNSNWCWALTTVSAQRLFEEVFSAESLQIEAHGNVLAAIAFLHGLAAEDLRPEELDQSDRNYEVLITVRAVKLEGEFGDRMIGKWDYQVVGQFTYGDDTTYKKGIAFLDGHGTIEDWGCGATYAKLFVKESKYIGIDGSQNTFTDKVVDLRHYTSKVDCIFIRHVLEHNHNWSHILANAVDSFTKRMVLIIFTPFSNQTKQLANWSDIPDISFRKEDLTEFFKHLKYTEESLETDTRYKTEHIFFIEK